MLWLISVSHGLLDRDAILYWMKTSHILFTNRGNERVDNATLELAESYLHLLVSHSGRQDQIQRLQLWKEKAKDVGKYFHLLSERSLERC